jgi:hypothetical protein
MPNWCNNYLKIAGDSKEIARFIQSVSRTDEDGNTYYAILHSLYPTPTELEETKAMFSTGDSEEMEEHNAKVARNIEKHGFGDWYKWRLHHWDTKWGDSDTYLPNDFQEGDTSTEFRFDTAWSPPVAGIVTISEQFPSLVFILSFMESGFGFVGAIGAHDGARIADVEVTFPDPSNFEDENTDDQQAHNDWYNAVLEAMDRAETEVIAGLHKSYKELFQGLRPVEPV